MKYLLAIAGSFAALTALPAQPARAAMDGDDVAQCLVDNDLRDVKALLRTLPGSDDERRVGARVMVFYGGCNDNTRADGQIGWRDRAEIANAALLDRLDGRRVDISSSPPRAGWALAAGGGAGYDRRLVSIRQFGYCVVGLAPGDALRLARSSRGSGDEAAAIAALQPLLNDCLAPRANFRLARADLRLVVAEPLYHMIAN